MKVLQFGQRADAGHFPLKSDPWNLSLKYTLERAEIIKEIQQEAGRQWVKLKNESAVIEQGRALLHTIDGIYAPTGLRPDQRIYDEAKSGKLKQQSPSQKTITTMKIAFWIALIAECTVMLIQQAVTGDFNPFIIVLAVLLGLGGFLQGLGLGNLLFKRWLDETIREGESLGQYWLLIGIGTALILLISGIRGISGTSPLLIAVVFFITLFFGEAVAVCEALAVKFTAQRRRLLQEMEQSQHWEANERHRQDLAKQIYATEYELAVKSKDFLGRS